MFRADVFCRIFYSKGRVFLEHMQISVLWKPGISPVLVEGEQKGTYLASSKFLLQIARDESSTTGDLG